MTAARTVSHWAPDGSIALREVSLGALLREAADAVPERVALVEGVAGDRRRWTYRELWADSERVAGALLERFAPGERVAVYAPNSPEWVLLQHAVALAGLLLVPLNPAYRSGEVETILRESGAAGIVSVSRFRDNECGEIAAALATRLPTVRETIALSQIREWTTSGPVPALPQVRSGDPFLLQFTSGTTGVPKGALLHHRGVINSAAHVADRAAFPDGGSWINAMPMFHIAGSCVTHMGCLSHRGTFVLAPAFEPGLMLDLIETEHGNASLIVPTMILAMLEHPDLARRDLSSLRTILSGAADVAPALVHRAKAAFGCEFTILYGQTEFNGNVSTTRREDSVEDQTTTVGIPIPHAEVKVADLDGNAVPVGVDGEICARGYQVMLGYDGGPESTAIDADGWLHTGDLGTMDARGYLRITGRLKDMIIRGGMNLYPREIEEVLFDHPSVAQVSVVGLPDPTWGEIVAAVVIPRDPGRPLPAGELEEFCRARLARHKVPRRWYVASEFPLTPSGKVQKFRLRELIADGRIEGVAAG